MPPWWRSERKPCASSTPSWGIPGADPDVRLHAPRTIAFFPPGPAAIVLMHHLETMEDGTLANRVLRALGRCRARDPRLPLDSTVLSRCLARTLADAFRALDRRLVLERGAVDEVARATAVHGLLVDLLRHRQAAATERLFRLVGLLYPGEDARSLYRGIHDPSPKVRDSSRELLEHLLDPPLQLAVLALVDDIPDSDRLARAQPYYEPGTVGYADTLGNLLDSGEDGTVRLVARHVAEIGAQELAPRLDRLRTSPSVTVVEAVEDALARLTRSEVTSDGS